VRGGGVERKRAEDDAGAFVCFRCLFVYLCSVFVVCALKRSL
jgi:hypothetical protein